MSAVMISPREAAQRPSAVLVDVRTPVEFTDVYAEGAVNVPLDQLNPKAVMSGKALGDNVLLLCKAGTRATKAQALFAHCGYANTQVVEGGTDAWVAAGLPTVRGQSGVISLERQVRIAAGLLVLIGVIFGITFSPWFLGLAAFVGAGLTFAGITNTCGMAMILTKMPWNNRVPACKT